MIKLGVAALYCAFGMHLIKNSKPPKEDYKESNSERIKRVGGESRVNEVHLYSINYEGDIKVKGTGQHVYSDQYDDRDLSDFEIKLQAREADCDVVLKVERHRTANVWTVKGIAYKKL